MCCVVLLTVLAAARSASQVVWWPHWFSVHSGIDAHVACGWSLSDRVGSSLGFLPTSSQCSDVMLSSVFALVSATKFAAMLALIMPRSGSDLLVDLWLSRLRSGLVNYSHVWVESAS